MGPFQLRSMASFAMFVFNFLLVSSLSAQSTFYIAENGDDDGAGTEIAPWETIDRVRDELIDNGNVDRTFLFARGGRYRGSISVPVFATNVNFGTYGTGSSAIIAGSRAIEDNAWTSLGAGLYSTPLALAADFVVKELYEQGQRSTLAREPDTGWSRTDNTDHVNGILNDPALTEGAGYWAGAELVLRINNWSYGRYTVLSSAPGTLTANGQFSEQMANYTGWGYFLCNKLELLDAQGEWYHDGAANVLYYRSNTVVPQNVEYVAMSVSSNPLERLVNNGIAYNTANGCTVTGLAFEHHAAAGVAMEASSNMLVDDCEFRDLGAGVAGDGGSGGNSISNCLIERATAAGIRVSAPNMIIEYNTLKDICLLPGEGVNNWGYIALEAANSTVQHNTLERVGYIGIGLQGSGVIANNTVSDWLITLNDGAGITIDNCDGVTVRDNVVHPVREGFGGRSESVAPDYEFNVDISFGIYFGNQQTRNVTVENNVVSGCAAGIHVDHTTESADNVIRNNVLFDNDVQLSIADNSNCTYVGTGANPCLNIPLGQGAPFWQASYNSIYEGNVMYCLKSGQRCMQQTNSYANAHEQLVDFGTFRNNYYFNPFSDVVVYQIVNYTILNVTNFLRESAIPHTLQSWQFPRPTASNPSPMPRDLGSTSSPLHLSDFGADAITAIPNDGFSANMAFGDVSAWTGCPGTGFACTECEAGFALSAIDCNWIERSDNFWIAGTNTTNTPQIDPNVFLFTFRMRSANTSAIRFGPVVQTSEIREFQYVGLTPEWKTYELVFDIEDEGGDDYMVSAFQNVQYSLGLLDASDVELDFIRAETCTLSAAFDGSTGIIAESHILRYNHPLAPPSDQNAGASFTIPGNAGECWSDVYGNFYAAGDVVGLDLHASIVLFKMAVPTSTLAFTNGVHTVSANATWTSNQNIAGSVVVPTGVTLTIDGAHIGFVESTPALTTNLIVETGGNLVLKNGATLRNWMGCDAPAALWDGVKVLGNGTHVGAGAVNLESGAHIMNAWVGIATANVGAAGPFSTVTNGGGLIQATNATFVNNLNDVIACEVTAFDPMEWGPLAFTNCTFKRDQVLPANVSGPGYRVVVALHSPITFESCAFTCIDNARSNGQQENGILNLNSRISVLGNENSGERSYFKGYDWALVSSAFDPTVFTLVDRCDFDGNAFGLLLAGADNSIVTNCNFAVADVETNASSGVEAAYGLYLYGCTGFEVEENTFVGVGTNYPKVGLVVRNSGIADNMFYNNAFSDFADASASSAGTIIMGNNASIDLVAGLRIKCNDYDTEASNDFDVAFTGSEVRIAIEQGVNLDATTPAGNTFALVDPLTCNGTEARHLYEDEVGALNSLNYWHHLPQAALELVPQCNNVQIALENTNWLFDKPTSCPIAISGIIPIEDDEEGAEAADDEYAVLKEVYANWKDGGNTRGLIEFIEDPAHSSYAVRNQLMLAAPKVSLEAWNACFDRETAMNPWHLAQALLANSPLERRVLSMIERSWLDPFYQELVLNGQNGGVSMHSIYKSEIAHFHSVKSTALQAMVRKSLAKGDSTALATTLNALATYPMEGKEVARFTLLLAQDDLLAGRSLVDDMLQDPRDERSLWLVYDLLLSLREANMALTDLDAAKMSTLQSIAATGSIGAAQAQAWLALVGNPLEEVVLLPTQSKRVKPQTPTHSVTTSSMLGAYPNPSNGPVYLTYTVVEGVEQAELRIHDAQGRLVKQQRLGTANGISEVQPRELAPGMHIASLYYDNILVGTTKLSIVR